MSSSFRGAASADDGDDFSAMLSGTFAITDTDLQDLGVKGSPISDMGVKGTGSWPWWGWVIVGVAILGFIVSFLCCCLQQHRRNNKKVAQEEDEAAASIDDDKNLNQPLIA